MTEFEKNSMIIKSLMCKRLFKFDIAVLFAPSTESKSKIPLPVKTFNNQIIPVINEWSNTVKIFEYDYRNT